MLTKVENTDSQARNIYLYRNRLVFLSEYHKCQVAIDRPWHVARILPPALTQIVATYMAYIRPAMYHFQMEISGKFPQSEYFFTKNGLTDKPWHTDVLKYGLQQATKDTKLQFNIAIYRHVAIAIRRQHLRSTYEQARFQDDRWGVIDPFATAAAWQAGHQTRRNFDSYALQKNYPTDLQPELLNRYFDVSYAWHQWLNIDNVAYLEVTSPSTSITSPSNSVFTSLSSQTTLWSMSSPSKAPQSLPSQARVMRTNYFESSSSDQDDDQSLLEALSVQEDESLFEPLSDQDDTIEVALPCSGQDNERAVVTADTSTERPVFRGVFIPRNPSFQAEDYALLPSSSAISLSDARRPRHKRQYSSSVSSSPAISDDEDSNYDPRQERPARRKKGR